MAHHKRGKRKDARAGCLMCKYWKATGFKHQGAVDAVGKQEFRARISEKEQRREAKLV